MLEKYYEWNSVSCAGLGLSQRIHNTNVSNSLMSFFDLM